MSANDPTAPVTPQGEAFLRAALDGIDDSSGVQRLDAGALLAGRYRVGELIARGGMGEVYTARDELLGEDLALKTLRPDLAGDARARERFKREIQLARKVSHVNVCRLYDVEVDDATGVAFLTMELLRGETLSDKLKRDERLAIAEALPIATQLAAGLDAAHAAGVVHRDLKSANVILVGARVVITDFGIAREASGEHTLTGTGRMVGTPAYMAPEQILGSAVGPRADIYSLGVVLFEMVTGKRPFGGEETDARRRLTGTPPSPRAHFPGLDPRWETTILRCLEVNPVHRLASGAEVLRALARGTSRRRPWLIPVSLAVGAIAAAGVVLVATRGTPAPAPAAPLGERRLTALTETWIMGASISPDGKRLAYTTPDGLFVQPTDGNDVRRVALPATFKPWLIDWFPDGEHLRIDDAESTQFSVSVQGGEPRRLLALPPGTYWTALSPDGAQLAFTNAQGLWVTALTDGTPRQLVAAEPAESCLGVAWSPDQRHLAFFSERQAVLRYYTVPAGGGERSLVTEGTRLAGRLGMPKFTWAPSGKLVFTMRDDAGGTGLWTAELDPATGVPAGKPRKERVIYAGHVDIYNSTRDGRLVMTHMDAQNDVKVTALGEGGLSGLRSITRDSFDDMGLDLTPDGQAMIITNNRQGKWNIYRQPLDGSPPLRLTAGEGEAHAAVLPDGSAMLHSAKVGKEFHYFRRSLSDETSVELDIVTNDWREAPNLPRIRCHGAVCILGEVEGRTWTFSRVDPQRGRGPLIARVTAKQEGVGAWDLDRAGERIVVMAAEPALVVVDVADGSTHELPVKPPCTVQGVAWAGKDELIASCSSQEAHQLWRLLRVHLDGRVETFITSDEESMDLPLVSADGHKLGVTTFSRAGNIFLHEGL